MPPVDNARLPRGKALPNTVVVLVVCAWVPGFHPITDAGLNAILLESEPAIPKRTNETA